MDGSFDDLRVWVNDILHPYRLTVADFGYSWRSGLGALSFAVILCQSGCSCIMLVVLCIRHEYLLRSFSRRLSVFCFA